MAKPFGEDLGSGMHAHISVLDKEGANIFTGGSNGKPADTLRHATGGLLETMAQMQAIFAPNPNSMRRLQGGSFAPDEITWGLDHRAAAVRLPEISDPAARLEHRICGADANPYLLFAVLLSAMLDGIEQNLSPGDPIVGDGYAQEEAKLPVYMPDAVDLFSESDFIRHSLGAELQRIYTLTKQQEIEEFRKRITQLEYQSFLKTL